MGVVEALPVQVSGATSLLFSSYCPGLSGAKALAARKGESGSGISPAQVLLAIHKLEGAVDGQVCNRPPSTKKRSVLPSPWPAASPEAGTAPSRSAVTPGSRLLLEWCQTGSAASGPTNQRYNISKPSSGLSRGNRLYVPHKRKNPSWGILPLPCSAVSMLLPRSLRGGSATTWSPRLASTDELARFPLARRCSLRCCFIYWPIRISSVSGGMAWGKSSGTALQLSPAMASLWAWCPDCCRRSACCFVIIVGRQSASTLHDRHLKILLNLSGIEIYYTMKKIVSPAICGIFPLSIVLLRMATWLGLMALRLAARLQGQSASIVQGDPSGTITRAFPWRENRWIEDWRVRYMIQYPTSMVTEWRTLDGEPWQ